MANYMIDEKENLVVGEGTNIIKKSLHIVKPENSDTHFSYPGVDDFLIECNTLGELLFFFVK